jgi:flagellar hook-associated protein 2
MATSSVGSSNGIDVSGIVSQLMTLERRPLQVLTQKEAQLTSRIAAYARVQGAVSLLQSAASTLGKAATFGGLRASVAGDGALAAVTDSSKASPGSYALKVGALASSQALASQAFAAGALLGTGTVTIELGSVAGGVFTPKSGSAATPITIDSSNNTLAGIRDAINAAKLGVTASVVNDNSGTRLTVIANDTGAANTIRIGVADGDGDNTDALGLSRLAFDPAVALAPGQTTAAGRQLTQTRSAADAAFEINGLALTSSSNKVTGAIEGVSLDLRKASPDSVTTVTIERDTATARAAVDSFVKAYNDLDRVVRDLTSYDAASRRGAVLNGDSAMRTLQSQLRALVRGEMTAAADDFTRLSSAGIEVGRDGALSVNAARFDAALSDPTKLSRLFTTAGGTQATQGFGVRIEAFAKAVVDGDGLLPSRTKSLQSQITDLDKQQDRMNIRLDQIEQRLRKQYTALDSQLQKMQGTSDSLANALKQLPGANSGR